MYSGSPDQVSLANIQRSVEISGLQSILPNLDSVNVESEDTGLVSDLEHKLASANGGSFIVNLDFKKTSHAQTQRVTKPSSSVENRWRKKMDECSLPLTDRNTESHEAGIARSSSCEALSLEPQLTSLISDSISSPSVQSVNSECDGELTLPASPTIDASAFQPIILDVRGSCSDNNFDCFEENDDLAASHLINPASQPLPDNESPVTQLVPATVMEKLKEIMDSSKLANTQMASRSEPTQKELHSLLAGVKHPVLSPSSNAIPSSSTKSLINSIPKAFSNSDGSLPSGGMEQKKLENQFNFSNFCVMVQEEASSSKVTAIMVPKEDGQGVLISPTVPMPHEAETKSVHSVDTPPAVMSLSLDELVKNLMEPTVMDSALLKKVLKKFDILGLKTTFFLLDTENRNNLMCKACGEIFESACGLNGHLVRTVFQLVYQCRYCKETYVFTNKCQLHLHTWLQHNKAYQPHNVICLRPLSENDILGPPLLETDDLEKFGASKALAEGYKKPICRTICGVASSGPGNELARCSVCHLCQTKPLLTEDKKKSWARCSMCGMYLASECAVTAHYSVHVPKVDDFVCPECGIVNDTSVFSGLKAFMDHVDQCCHFNRVSQVQCPCDEPFTNAKVLTQHFLNKHIRALYKCPKCVLAFTLHNALLIHLSAIHHSAGESIKLSSLCTYCHVIINNAEQLESHIKEHVDKLMQTAVLKWKCFLCDKLFTYKEELQEHSNTGHSYKAKRCTICFALFSSRRNLVDHIMQKKCCFQALSTFHRCVDAEGEKCDTPNYQQYFFKDNKTISKTLLRKIAPKNKIAIVEQQQSNQAILQARTAVSNPTITNQCPSLKAYDTKKITCNGKSYCQITPKSPDQYPKIVNKQLTFLKIQGNSSVPNSGNSISSVSKPTAAQCPRLPTLRTGDHLFQCHRCKIVIFGQAKYNLHVEKHIKSGDLQGSADESVCVVCKMQVKNSDLLLHLKNHQTEGVIVCCLCQRTDFSDMQQAVNHPNILCGYSILTGIEVSMKQSAPKQSLEAEEILKSSPVTPETAKASSESHTVKESEASVFPCLLCGLAFQSKEIRDEHVSRLHDGIRMVYHCVKCGMKDQPKSFSTKESAIRHLLKKHRVVTLESQQKFIIAEEINASNGQKLPEMKKTSDDPSAFPPPKRLRLAEEGDYMCGRCGFSCSSSQEFRSHIQSHNANNEPQCPECGLCFIILSALKKHMFAVHKIKNMEEFFKANNISISDSVEDEEQMEVEVFPLPALPKKEVLSPSVEKRAVNPLECTVCYKVFEFELDLKTHMRNHGMAFIRSKRHKI